MAEESLDLADPLNPNDTQAAQELIDLGRDEAVADAQEALRTRRNAYIRLFGGAAQRGDKEIVFSDLRTFCRASKTPWDADPRVHALLTGRFEVFMRIEQHMNMPFDDLWALLSGE